MTKVNEIISKPKRIIRKPARYIEDYNALSTKTNILKKTNQNSIKPFSIKLKRLTNTNIRPKSIALPKENEMSVNSSNNDIRLRNRKSSIIASEIGTSDKTGTSIAEEHSYSKNSNLEIISIDWSERMNTNDVSANLLSVNVRDRIKTKKNINSETRLKRTENKTQNSQRYNNALSTKTNILKKTNQNSIKPFSIKLKRLTNTNIRPKSIALPKENEMSVNSSNNDIRLRNRKSSIIASEIGTSDITATSSAEEHSYSKNSNLEIISIDWSGRMNTNDVSANLLSVNVRDRIKTKKNINSETKLKRTENKTQNSQRTKNSNSVFTKEAEENSSSEHIQNISHAKKRKVTSKRDNINSSITKSDVSKYKLRNLKIHLKQTVDENENTKLISPDINADDLNRNNKSFDNNVHSNNVVSVNSVTKTNKRQPIYKRIARNSPVHQTGGDAAIYDYFPNPPESSSEDSSMKRIIEKLRRENKIQLIKKPTQKKKLNHSTKPAFFNKRNKIQRLHKSLKEILTKKTAAVETNNISYIETISDDDHDAVDIFTDDINDHDNQHIKSIASTNVDKAHKTTNTKTTISQKQTLSNEINPKISGSNHVLYKMSLTKPNFQSTPLRTSKITEQNTSMKNNSLLPMGNASPWRVENENIPNVLYFAKSNDHLLTYSSDVLQSDRMSMRNEKIRRLEYSLNENEPDRISSANNLIETINISNIENVEPKDHHEILERVKSTTTNIVLSERNIPRSPLKTLTIKNVLPSPRGAAGVKHINIPSGSPTKMVSNVSNVSNVVNPTYIFPNISTSSSIPQNSSANILDSIDEFFGFGNNTENETISPEKKINKNNSLLKEKLHNLQKLFPPKCPNTPKMITTKPTNIFNEPSKKENNIMIYMNKPDKAKKAVNVENPGSSTSVQIIDEAIGNEAYQPELFDSLLPTSVKYKSRKTYGMKSKRKRFIMEMEVTDDEDDDKIKKKRIPQKKRNKMEIQKKNELNQFVQEFNSMCKNIDQYELIIDKSK